MTTLRPAITFPALLAVMLGLLAGCAGRGELACERHEQRMRTTKPVTVYKPVAPRPGETPVRSLPPGSVAMAPTYRMHFKPPYAEQCSTITLVKDVVIQRSTDHDVVLTEVREFYAEDGTLITSTPQDITDQVPASGTYVATTALPIPRTAPPGRYKIVSKLLYERRGASRQPLPIARAEAQFFIVPRR